MGRLCIPLECTDRDTAYKLLYQARELIGKAHDLIVHATDYRGEHNITLIGLCPRLNDAIETLNDACGVAPRE